MAKEKTPFLLIVDDEEYNLKIIQHHLKDMNFNISTAQNGKQALTFLEKTNNNYDLILLDRIMPDMDGLEILNKIKANKRLNEIPVIFQTSMTSEKDIYDGLQAGAHYYLTKPYDKKLMISVIQNAYEEYDSHRQLQKAIQDTNQALVLMKQCQYHIKTIEDAYTLSIFFRNFFPKKTSIAIGMYEILVNAVEHGNLGITYTEKSSLKKENRLEEEIKHRLAKPENKDKHVIIDILKENDLIYFTVKDTGPGFDWEPYLKFSTDRAFDNHGRGIALAMISGFNKMEYIGCGNEVKITIEDKYNA